MDLDGKSSQEYPVNAGVPQGSILVLTLFLLEADLRDTVDSGKLVDFSAGKTQLVSFD